MDPLTVIVLGTGQMGISHALAYHANPGFRILALINRSIPKSLPAGLKKYPIFQTLEQGLLLNPAVVSINTHAESHAEYVIASLNAGAHVFVEKPLATTVEDARAVVAAARKAHRKLLIGYILRHHPSWKLFIQEARNMESPSVMRFSLNQRSSAHAWGIHKSILANSSPVIDCGVHYIDAMLQICAGRPIQVRGMGTCLTDDILPDRINYGNLQILFDDGSVGWYEAGWGPMISETAHSVKDVFGPKGAVSIVTDGSKASADVDGHTQVVQILVHAVGSEKRVLHGDKIRHNDLCALEQMYLLESIREDRDLSEHWDNALLSLAVVLAGDQSMRENRAVDL